MPNELQGRKVAFLAAHEGVEQIELTEPWKAVKSAGADVQLVSNRSGKVQGFNHLDKADTFQVDHEVSSVSADDYDALVLPGGVANPDILRTVPEAVSFVKSFVKQEKPLGAICHAPWTLIEADVLRGRTVTSYPSLQTDLRNAGANWVDEEVVVCEGGPNTLVSSRNPDDLPAFNDKAMAAFAA